MLYFVPYTGHKNCLDKLHSRLHTGASYVSSTLISLINRKTNKNPIRTEPMQTETLVSSSMKKIPVYSVELKDINNEVKFGIEISKLEKSALFELP